jgi:NAD(P)-dependent dehydrogenase (short-subunit alcohol dehydrogenase family)
LVELNQESRDGHNGRGFSSAAGGVDWFTGLRVAPPAELAEGRARRPRGPGSSFSTTAARQRVAEDLCAAGLAVTTVRPGPGFAPVGDSAYEIAPDRRSDYVRLLEAAGRPQHVVHAWGVSPEDPRPLSERLDSAQERGFLSLLFLAQALARAQSKAPLRIAVVTTGMQDVVGGDLTSPEKATVLGPCRVIPQEMANATCQAIDLEAPPRGAEVRLVARLVVAELVTGQPEPVVAYRRGYRWVSSVEPTRIEPANGRLPLEHRSVTRTAVSVHGRPGRHLAERWQARLVLTGRSRLPAREQWSAQLESADAATRQRIRDVMELEALGAEVLYVGADVSRPDEMRAAVLAGRDRFGPIRGVVHAAGVPGGGVIPFKEPEAAARVMAPKVQGTLALQEALVGEPLDFFVLCSSTAALLGGFGQVDYCGANAFLDAYAHRGAPCVDGVRQLGCVVRVAWPSTRPSAGAPGVARRPARSASRHEATRSRGSRLRPAAGGCLTMDCALPASSSSGAETRPRPRERRPRRRRAWRRPFPTPPEASWSASSRSRGRRSSAARTSAPTTTSSIWVGTR